MSLLDALKRRILGSPPEAPEIRADDGFIYRADDEDAGAQALLDAVASELAARTPERDVRAKELAAARSILEAAPDVQAGVLVALLRRRSAAVLLTEPSRALYERMIEQLLRRDLPYTTLSFTRLLAAVSQAEQCLEGGLKNFSWGILANHAERIAARHTLDGEARRHLLAIRAATDGGAHTKSKTRALLRLAALAGSVAETARLEPLPLEPGEAWADVVLADCKAMDAERRRPWLRLIEHAARADGTRPSKSWRLKAAELVAGLARDELCRRLPAWFERIDVASVRGREVPRLVHEDVLKGLAWACAEVDEGELRQALAALALAGYRKHRGLGARSVKIGNAAVWALGEMPDGIDVLARLKVGIPLRAAQTCLAKTLSTVALRAGIPQEEIDEMSVSAFGLTEVGRRDEDFGEVAARLTVDGRSGVRLVWLTKDAAGTRRSREAPPAAFERDFADEVKDLKAAARDAERTWKAQRARLEGLFLARKSWPWDVWHERYLDHPVVGTLARRLLWSFDDGSTAAVARFDGGQLRTADDQPLGDGGESTRVQLWHPIEWTTEDIEAWRELLPASAQPFEQVHREVFRLRGEERQGVVLWERFAGRVVRQRELQSASEVRGWKKSWRTVSPWGDSRGEKTVGKRRPPVLREIPAWGLRAALDVDGVGAPDEIGTYEFLRLGALRFHPIDAGDEHRGLPLTRIPTLVVSEVLRDVAFFAAR